MQVNMLYQNAEVRPLAQCEHNFPPSPTFIEKVTAHDRLQFSIYIDTIFEWFDWALLY